FFIESAGVIIVFLKYCESFSTLTTDLYQQVIATMSSQSAESSARIFHHNLLKQFIQAVQQQPPFILDDCEPEWLEYLSELETLPRLHEPDYSAQGQTLLCRSIA